MAATLDDFPLVARIPGLKRKSPTQAYAPCPCHETHHDSLSVGITGKGTLGLHCFAECPKANILAALGALWSDLFPVDQRRIRRGQGHQHSGQPSRGSNPKKGPIVARYDFRDETGTLLYQECRHQPKDFSLRQPDPKSPGRWVNSITNPPVRRVLYRLPELLHAVAANPHVPIFLPEGPRKADYIRGPDDAPTGLTATSTAGGAAAAWQDSYSEPLRGRRVYLLRDNDPPNKSGQRPGYLALIKRATALLPVCEFVGECVLPPLGSLKPPDQISSASEKWDFIDWAKAGGTPAMLLAAAAAARPFNPAEHAAASPDGPNEAADDPHRLARLYLDRYQHADGLTLRYWRESFHRWTGRSYRRVPTFEIRAELAASIKDEFDRLNLLELSRNHHGGDEKPEARKATSRITTDVLQALTGMTLLPEEIEQPAWLDDSGRSVDPERSREAHDYVSMANGILDVRLLLADSPDVGDSASDQPDDPPNIILPHSPRFFSPISLPYEFNPSADCPTWIRFTEVNLESDADRIAMLQEWFGYCLTFDTSHQKFLLMEGEGSNGKSVICAALTALLGLDNVSHVPLEIFGKDFALTQTLGKLANIASEVGEIDKMAEGFLKSFTSGDRMTFNRKNQSLIESTPTARLVLSTNNRPRFSDRSGGIWRRMLMLPLAVQIEEADKIHGMDKPEWWHASGELPGVFCWAVAGLHRLRQHRRFTDPALSSQALSDYRAESNPARLFLQQNYEPSVTGQVVTKTVYTEYKKWCDENNYRPLSSSLFGKEIRRVFPGSKESDFREEISETRPGTAETITIKTRRKGYLGVQKREEVIAEEMAEHPENFSF